MSLDTATKRRAAGGVAFLPLGPGVTPDAAKGASWRAQAGWSYGRGDASTGAAWLVTARRRTRR